MEEWVANFGVRIGFWGFDPNKDGVLRNFAPLPPPPPRGKHRKHVFEQNSAPNYLTMTKLHMEILDFNTKNSFSAILEFSILSKSRIRWISKNLDFRIQLGFKLLTVKKFNMSRRLDLNTKKLFSEFSIVNFKGKNR